MIPGAGKTFQYVRVESPADVPVPGPRILDVAILDMNFGYLNLGHDSLVQLIRQVGRELAHTLENSGLALRGISGHIDPNRNDGKADWSQEVSEDPAWEPAAQRLFAAILSEPDAAMLGICHTFGVLCRWLGVATPTLRGPEKGGKSTGMQWNVFTDAARAHPWFGRFAGELGEGRRLLVRDSRLFDLIPGIGPLPPGMTAIGHESLPSGERGDALTMLELARDRGGVMPRFFAVNHHPEVYDADMQRRLIEEKRAAGTVTPEWLAERIRIVTDMRDPTATRELALCARLTLIDPLRFFLFRQVRLRHERLFGRSPVHEDQILTCATSEDQSIAAVC
ncbi:MAG: hypothetical protein HY815_08370 [Candidatus Riflebacteria bacterium]|nr:hypothetical protein [Candidatus Riflebacteria bacterium]